MSLLLGIDLGTTRIKALIVEADSLRAVGQASREIGIAMPHPGHAEQDPADWWQTTVTCVHSAIADANINTREIAGIGLSGQMHSTVCLDRSLQPIRPAIIWADRRSADYVDLLMERISLNELVWQAPGLPAAGYMALTLMWLRDHEPHTYHKTHRVLFPKDFLRLRLTGEAGTERSDASAGWLLDIPGGEWSARQLELCRLDNAMLPPLADSWEPVGDLTKEAVQALGLPAGIPVAAGAADMAAQAIGHGLIDPGKTLLILGTGGQIFLPLAQPQPPIPTGLYIYRHAAPQRWYAQSALLAGGLALQWLRDTLGLAAEPDAFKQLSSLAADIPPGSDGLTIIPYLAGTRRLDGARDSGAMMGLRLDHGRGHLTRAMMEGVAFAMRECLDQVGAMPADGPATLLASGGAVSSPVWRQIMADVLGQALHIQPGSHHAALGAALLGGVAAGLYESVTGAVDGLPKPNLIITHDQAAHAVYSDRYEVFKELTTRLRSE